MAAVQMNVRIDEETKARGDEVFARWGLTPSQVVRAVWEYAEEKGEPPAFMRPARGAEHDAEVQRRLALVREGAAIWRNFFLDNGLPVPAPRKITCEDLREDCLLYTSAARPRGRRGTPCRALPSVLRSCQCERRRSRRCNLAQR